MDTHVYTSKIGGVVITNPSFGRTGWRDGEEVVYDSKSKPPRWLTLAEFKIAKELRSQAWKKMEGPKLFRSKRSQDDERFFGRQIVESHCEDPAPEGERPDPIPVAARQPEQKTEAVRRRQDEGPSLDGAPRKPKTREEADRAHFGPILTRAFSPG